VKGEKLRENVLKITMGQTRGGHQVETEGGVVGGGQNPEPPWVGTASLCGHQSSGNTKVLKE